MTPVVSDLRRLATSSSLSLPTIPWRREKMHRHDVIWPQAKLNMSFGTSTPRICNERYYYVQDSAYFERSTANAACIVVELLRLSRSVKDLAAWTARSRGGADMNSALRTIARNQGDIDPKLQSLSDQQTKHTISRLHTHPKTLLGASDNIGKDRWKSLVICLVRWQRILPLGFSLTTVIVERMARTDPCS
ncbi:hypothetical protein BGAL_0175g00170 [Botrytis galanthina]|uniref:Uncharacterized protein n=1 Tax=Botrytis galanthina TaxID=278940 RepID=A0A4S8QY00_9HELO|nr:hypothetical protein BGAL_0175g00170 [Botrytis galanthina]